MVDLTAERIVAHIESLPGQPPPTPTAASRWRARSPSPSRRRDRPADELLDLLFDRVIPKSFNTAGPGYLAYIPGGGLPHAAVAD